MILKLLQRISPRPCQLCGRKYGVRRNYIRLWNGTRFTLCISCVYRTGLATVIDEVSRNIVARYQDAECPS